MTVAVLGASGMLGSMVVRVLSTSMSVTATVRDVAFMRPMDRVEWRHLDVLDTDVSDLTMLLHGCCAAINCIGVVTQRMDDTVWKVNSVFPQMLALAAARADCHVLQIATDCVFDGQNGTYAEHGSEPRGAPRDKYGMSKWQGEVRSPWVRHVRCSIVGPEYHGKSLLGWFLAHPPRSRVEGYTNHFWNGVTTQAFAQVCRGIVDNPKTIGDQRLPWVQHLVPADRVSKYQLLSYFRECYRPDINVIPVRHTLNVDRTLTTVKPEVNERLWRGAGYPEPPPILRMIQDMARAEVTI